MLLLQALQQRWRQQITVTEQAVNAEHPIILSKDLRTMIGQCRA